MAKPELTMGVVTRGPQSAIWLHHRGVGKACRDLGGGTNSDLLEHIPVGESPVPKLTFVVPTRGPQTVILIDNCNLLEIPFPF